MLNIKKSQAAKSDEYGGWSILVISSLQRYFKNFSDINILGLKFSVRKYIYIYMIQNIELSVI